MQHTAAAPQPATRMPRHAAVRMALALVLALACTVPAQAKPAAPSVQAAARTTCAGFAAVPMRSPAGTCVAQVAGAAHGLKMPRRILEVAPNRFWIVDMGQWEAGHGRILEMLLTPAAQRQ